MEDINVGKAEYVGAKLSSLIYDEWEQFHRKYPDVLYNTWKGKKHYWKLKIKKGEMPMPPRPEQLPPEPKLVKTWEVAMRGQDGEWDTTTLHSYEHPDPDNLSERFSPATPAKITPSRRKPQVRDHKVLYVFSDAQIDYRRINDELVPIHDERALEVGRMICKDVMPDEIINLGDTVDLASLSRFKPDSDHFHKTLGPSFQRIHDYYAGLIADSPWAKITEVDSNHNTRLKDFFMKNTPDLYGFRRPGDEDQFPMFTYPYMANLGALGINWISGYGAAEYEYGLEYDKPSIVFKHGKTAVSGGSTAAKESRENPYNHVVRGHSHRIEGAYRTNRHGHYLGSFVVGASCKITGEVPSYHSAVDDEGQPVKFQEDWQTGVMVIEDYEGEYVFNQIPIRNGTAYFRGKEYKAE